MAAPTVRGVGAIASGIGATTIPQPSGTTAGDLLLAFVENSGEGATTIANYTQLTASITGAGTRLYIFYRIATNSDTCTTNDVGDHQIGRMIGITAGTFDATSPFGASTIVTNDQAATTSISISGGTTTRNDCLIFAASAGSLPDATSSTEFGAATNASLASITERIDNAATAGNGGSLYVVTGTLATAGTYNATTLTAVTSAVRNNASFSVRPPSTTNLTQAAYRYYEDGTETGSTAIDAQNTNITRDVTSDSNLQLRVRLQETTGGYADNTDDYQLQYELNDSGVYAPVGSGRGSAIDVYDETNSSVDVSLNNNGVGQSFPGNGSTLGTTRFYLSKLLSPVGVLVSKVYAHSGTFGTSSVPTGAALATSEAIDVSLLNAGPELVEFFFIGSNQVTLASGTNYVVTVETTSVSSGGNAVQVARDSSSPTHAGNYSLLSGGSWSASSTSDLIFYVNSISAPVIGYNSSSLTDGNATTNRLGAGTGSFVAGEISEDGLVDDHHITPSNYTEHLYSLTLVSAALANSDTLDFRVLRNGATTGMTYTVTPRITASKSAGVSATPTTASLALTAFAPIIGIGIALASPTALALNSFAPSVVVNNRVTPTTPSLSLTSFTPTIVASDHKLVTPSTTSLTLTGNAPTVVASDHKSATPTTASLSLTGFAPILNLGVTPSTGSLTLSTFTPTVVATNNQSATPTTATLSLTTFAPTVAVSDNKSATPSTTSLALTAFAPTVSTTDNKTATPSTGTLNLTTFAPTISISNNQFATPSTTSLVLTGYEPTVTASSSQTFTPSTASLTLTTFAPTIATTAHQYVTPTTGNLTLTGFSPRIDLAVTPGMGSLTLSTFAPTLAITDNKTATPTTSALSLTTFAPVVFASDHKSATPTTASLSLSAFAPIVIASDHKLVTPTTASLTLTGYAPLLNLRITPSTGTLTLTSFAPTVSASDNKSVTPSLASLSLTGFAPTITADNPVSATPTTGSLSLTLFTPTVSVTNNVSITPSTASLALTGYAPILNLSVTPSTATLSLTTFSPSVTTSDNKTATPSTASLSLSPFAPTISLSDNKIVAPTTGSLNLTSYTPHVTRYAFIGAGEEPDSVVWVGVTDTSGTFTPVSETSGTWIVTDATAASLVEAATPDSPSSWVVNQS